MVCLTSCVFRSIRFSGFARPHFGVRREGELYTQAQGGGKGVSARAQDGHKLGDNSCFRRAFPPTWRGYGGSGPAAAGRASPPIALATHTYMLHSKPETATQGAPTDLRLSRPGGTRGNRLRHWPARQKRKRPASYCKETDRTKCRNYLCWRKPICPAAFTPAQAPRQGPSYT